MKCIHNIIKKWKEHRPFTTYTSNISFICVNSNNGQFTKGREYRPYMYRMCNDGVTNFVIVDNNGSNVVVPSGAINTVFKLKINS